MTTVTGPEDREDVFQLLQDLRTKISRTELARLTGITGARLWRMERGRIHADEVEPVGERLREVDRVMSNGYLRPEFVMEIGRRLGLIHDTLSRARDARNAVARRRLLDEALVLTDRTEVNAEENAAQTG